MQISNVKRIGTNNIEITFNNNEVFIYENVPTEEYMNFKTSSNLYEYFNRNIKNKYKVSESNNLQLILS